MVEIKIFGSGNKQSIMVNNPQAREEPFFVPKKIMNFILAMMLIRFIQEFPPAEGGLVRGIGQFGSLNRTARSGNWKLNPKTEKEKSEKTNKRKEKSDAPTIPEVINVSLPNGLKLSAAGYYTVLILSVLCGLIFVCERFTNIIMCICNRLNTPVRNAEVERVR